MAVQAIPRGDRCRSATRGSPAPHRCSFVRCRRSSCQRAFERRAAGRRRHEVMPTIGASRAAALARCRPRPRTATERTIARKIESALMILTAVCAASSWSDFMITIRPASGPSLCWRRCAEADPVAELLDERAQVEHDVAVRRRQGVPLSLDDVDQRLVRLAVRLLPERLHRPGARGACPPRGPRARADRRRSEPRAASRPEAASAWSSAATSTFAYSWSTMYTDSACRISWILEQARARRHPRCRSRAPAA